MQGLGRHSFEFVLERYEEELSACATMLATSDGPYLTGKTPCQADCYLWAHLELARALHICLSCLQAAHKD
jgi:glutathione S-transferase